MKAIAGLLACLLVAACGASNGGGGGEGGSCDPTTDCDEGFACSITHTASGEGSCLPADEDVDGDGLTNANDYCNSSEGGQYDEDRDLIGDACDRCPIAPPQGTDPDGDEVDSPCDPDPREPGDKIVLFNGFREGIPSGWKMTGTWEQRGGDVVVTPPTSTAIVQLTSALPLVAQNMSIQIQYRVDSVDTTAQRSFVGLIGRDERPGNLEEVRCGGQRSTGTNSLAIETKAQAAAEPVVDAFDSASLYSIAMRVQNLNAACAMIADTATVATQASTGGEPLSEAGMFVQGATARFQYLLVIQRSAN